MQESGITIGWREITLKSTKLVIGILSIILSVFVLFQGCTVNVYEAYANSEIQGRAPGIILAIMLLIAGITAIVTRNSRGGGIVAGLIYALGGGIGLMGKGSVFGDLEVWTWVCFTFAVIFIFGSILFMGSGSGRRGGTVKSSGTSNTHIQMSVKVFADSVRAFEQRMEATAQKKDGSVSKEDVRYLNALNRATDRFVHELEGFIGNTGDSKSVNSGKPVWVRVIVGILIAAIVAGAVLFGVWTVKCNYPEPLKGIMEKVQGATNRTVRNDDSGVQTPEPTMQATKETGNRTIIVSDTIDAEFIGFEDHPELGMFSVRLRVTNKTDQPIWVYMDKASINDEMMQMVMTGMPLYIDPGKRGSNGFIFYYKQTSIEQFDDVSTVSFKLKVDNQDTMKEIWTSPEVTLTK